LGKIGSQARRRAAKGPARKDPEQNPADFDAIETIATEPRDRAGLVSARST
jgi:hypothetical protein